MVSSATGNRYTYERELLDQLVEALCAAFAQHAQVSLLAYPEADSNGANAVIQIHSGRDIFHIAVDILRDAYPRDIRHALWRLDTYKSLGVKPQNVIRLVAANSLSPGAKDALAERGCAYFESNGSLYLRAKQWLINIEREAKSPHRCKPLPLFTEARESVVHALLSHANEWVTGQDLAQLANASPYTCSVVLQELERLEWCETKGGGPTKRRRLIKPAELLDGWAERWLDHENATSHWYTFVADPHTLLDQLSDKIERSAISFPWAFTGAAAANRYAPLLTSTDTVEIIVPPGCSTLLADGLQLKPASSGSNVTIIERDGASLLFRQAHPALPAFFASPFVLYMDLLDGRGRNKELAHHVRERLEAEWHTT